MGQGGGREGELLRKKRRKFLAKISYFLTLQFFKKKILGNVEKLQFFGVREGVKGFFSPNPSIGWSENGLRKGDLLEGKSAYGYPPPPPPLPTYALDKTESRERESEKGAKLLSTGFLLLRLLLHS